MTKVAYMVAVKRSSLLVSVVIGRVFFEERGLRRRLPGAALMFAGVLSSASAPDVRPLKRPLRRCASRGSCGGTSPPRHPNPFERPLRFSDGR